MRQRIANLEAERSAWITSTVIAGSRIVFSVSLVWFTFVSQTRFSLFFLKHPEALGSHVRFLNAHVDRTQRRRNYQSSLETHHTETYAHPHTRTHAITHTHTESRHPGAGRGLEPPPAASHPRELPLGHWPVRLSAFFARFDSIRRIPCLYVHTAVPLEFECRPRGFFS